jgi:hypothetical protein
MKPLTITITISEDEDGYTTTRVITHGLETATDEQRAVEQLIVEAVAQELMEIKSAGEKAESAANN